MAIVKKTCTMCGKEKNQKDFYLSYSPLYKENDRRVTVCKDCMVTLYEALMEEYQSETIALNKICNMFDTYYSERAYNTAKQQAKKQDSSIVKIYFQKINSLAQFKGYTSRDSENVDLTKEISKRENVNIEDIKEDDITGEISLTKDVISRWGYGLEKMDYLILENYYQELIEAYESKTPTQKWLYQDIARSKLEAEKCRRRSDLKGYSDMIKTISIQMADSNIKPVQKNAIGDENSDCWGTWVRMIEDNEPVGEVSEEYKDVDKIEKYIDKWFIKPFARVLGLTDSEENFDEKLKEAIIESKGDN